MYPITRNHGRSSTAKPTAVAGLCTGANVRLGTCERLNKTAVINNPVLEPRDASKRDCSSPRKNNSSLKAKKVVVNSNAASPFASFAVNSGSITAVGMSSMRDTLPPATSENNQLGVFSRTDFNPHFVSKINVTVGMIKKKVDPRRGKACVETRLQ